jgi:hypothetical protein
MLARPQPNIGNLHNLLKFQGLYASHGFGARRFDVQDQLLSIDVEQSMQNQPYFHK